MYPKTGKYEVSLTFNFTGYAMELSDLGNISWGINRHESFHFFPVVDGGESLMSIERSSPELWLFSVELSKACLLPKIHFFSYKEEQS